MTTDASAELTRIRDRFERSHMTVNPDDTVETLVSRCLYLASPEDAGKVWFDRWQIERQCTKALRMTLSGLLSKLDDAETPGRDEVDEAWKVLSDVQHLMPEVAPTVGSEARPGATGSADPGRAPSGETTDG